MTRFQVGDLVLQETIAMTWCWVVLRPFRTEGFDCLSVFCSKDPDSRIERRSLSGGTEVAMRPEEWK